MECTNVKPAGYRRHREQSNPNAASRDQNGANMNPLHHTGFYRPPGFFLQIPRKKRADERTRTADLLITSEIRGVSRDCTHLQNSLR
jgi:hypothetical protein